jgi:uncharacterized repeat protein (TIGR03803 family)
VFSGFLSLVLSLSAQTLTTLHSFDGKDGSSPLAGLVQATNGDLYGTTDGVAHGCGTVFKITPTGTLTSLLIFKKKDGCYPYAGLVQATNGGLYGTTVAGTACNYGTVFKVTQSGKLMTLHSFCGEDGAYPYAGLVQDAAGNLYGTTEMGGSYDYYGTVFKITPSGTVTTLYSFENGTDGANPYAGVVQATDGNLFGTTESGGANGAGTVFKITPSGTFTMLYTFCSKSGCKDGGSPHAGLVQATDGNLYGTTVGGNVYNGDGTVFKITASGKLTTLHSFDGTDGASPYAGLVQATDGNLYGTTDFGGANCVSDGGCGTVFKITPKGKLTTLHSFDGTDGADPYAGLVQYTDGNLYGTTATGGSYGRGTVFSLSVGLGPFVETQPTSGKVGTAVKILGTDLTGASRVTFNGTAARFKVISKSEIETNVPSGATTGTVEVKTKNTLKSNVVFRVTK